MKKFEARGLRAWWRLSAWLGIGMCIGLCVGGCMTYTTPGGGADFRALGITPAQADALTNDQTIQENMNRRPLAAFPAHVAVIRVQDRYYRSASAHGYGDGAVSVVTHREAESPEAIAKLSGLPGLAGLAAVNRLVLPRDLNSEADLRRVASSVQADMLLLYTLDTRFFTDTTVPALGTITLGLFPNERASVTTTASAALIDTRSGFIYGLCEATHKETQLANAWTSQEAVEQSRRRAEAKAFEQLTDAFAVMWKDVAARYGPASGSVP